MGQGRGAGGRTELMGCRKKEWSAGGSPGEGGPPQSEAGGELARLQTRGGREATEKAGGPENQAWPGCRLVSRRHLAAHSPSPSWPPATPRGTRQRGIAPSDCGHPASRAALLDGAEAETRACLLGLERTESQTGARGRQNQISALQGPSRPSATLLRFLRKPRPQRVTSRGPVRKVTLKTTETNNKTKPTQRS